MKHLYEKFIGNYHDINDSKVREKYGVLAGVLGVFCNVTLVILKLIVGIITNSISIMGDAFNNLGDTCSSFINVFSFKINNKPADKEHPYGHRRIEYVGSLLISVLIFVVAVELITTSIEKIINPTPTIIAWYILLILAINIIFKSFMAIVYFNMSKKINSISLYASYKDSLNDILTTIIVVVGLYASKYLNVDLDGYLGIALAIFIIISAIKLVKQSIDKLLGEPYDDEIVKNIIEYILNTKEILGVHDVLTHQYGEGKVFMSLHAEMDGSNTLNGAHDIIDRLERKVKKIYNIELLIHIDPIDFSNKELKKMKNMIERVVKQIDENLSTHDIRITSGEKKRLYFDLEMPYSYNFKSKELIDILIAEISRRCDYKISIEINYK